MNRLTNEQSLQIMKFYYQNVYSVKKVYCALLSFYNKFNWPTESAIQAIQWLNFSSNFHCWTLDHQHAYVEWELNKISQLYRPVLMMTINYRFVAVRSNWTSVTQQRGKILRKNLSVKLFQNIACARIEAERPTARRIFGECIT